MLHEGLEGAAARQPDHVAIRAGTQRWSFRDVDRLSNGCASHLTLAGVRPGDRVAVMLSNRIELVVMVHAVSKLRAASVLLSPAWKAAEVDHALGLTAPVHAVADGAAVALLRERLPVTDVDAVDAVAWSAQHHAPDVVGDDTAEAVLVFSSGTTGMPKAVRHTHRSLGLAARHWVAALGLTGDDRFQVATPPSHILGLLNLLAAAAAGATVRLHPRFDLDEVLRCIVSDRLTLEMAVAPIALAMANHPRLEEHDLSSLRFILWGATPVTPSVADTVTARTGVRWLQGYGASELPVIACNPVHEPDRWRLDSPGLPVPGVELRAVALDTGAVLAPGEVGEIQARSPSLMAGYLPEDANQEAFVDGWYRTGDVGWLEPDGWVHLTDRAKEMIKVNAFQVAPAEIEAVLHGHPAVLDCAVFGIPDERAGEVPVAAVQLDPTHPVTSDELQRLLADSLATYKQIRQVVVVESIPRLPSGKVLRRTLRDELLMTKHEIDHGRPHDPLRPEPSARADQ
jgi:acyl-CoA synthetase (AMP-forming)/AMP-acid ligase II